MAAQPILVIDDNPLDSKLVQILLSNEDYEVRTAPNAEEGVAMLAGFRPRLILLDIQLPGMNGWDLTRLIKADRRTHDIVVVGLTAHWEETDQKKAVSVGFDGYMPKPIDTRTFTKTIASYLR